MNGNQMKPVAPKNIEIKDAFSAREAGIVSWVIGISSIIIIVCFAFI